MGYLVSSSKSHNQLQVWIPFLEVGFKSNPMLVGYSHKLSAIIAILHEDTTIDQRVCDYAGVYISLFTVCIVSSYTKESRTWVLNIPNVVNLMLI